VPKIAARSWNKRLDWSEKGGSRAEVRRERKKRDILSPANVLLIIYQKALCKDYPFRNSRDEIIVQPSLLRCQAIIAYFSEKIGRILWLEFGHCRTIKHLLEGGYRKT